MPQIDLRSGDVVVRIVYDGMPEAGKTTNIQQLFQSIPLQRRGTTKSPETKGRATEFFDWVDFVGGFVAGRRVRCQLISVPGQSQLLHRRKYLLDTADAVVFVADSSPAHVNENRTNFATLVRLLERLEATVPVGIIVQANKQDVDGALRPRSLAAAIEVPVTVPVIPAVAQSGRGVMDTFVLAARLATDRVRAMMGSGADLPDLADQDSTPDALHAAMRALETQEASPSGAPSRAKVDVRSFVRRRPNDVATAEQCRLPRPEVLTAGHVWPPVKGRAVVAAAAGGALTVPTHAVDWAPPEPIEVEIDSGWWLHSSSQWSFATEGEARLELMTKVRRLVAAPDLVPEGRALFVAPHGDGFRIWMLTPRVLTVADELLDALGRRDGRGVSAAFASATRVTTLLREAVGRSRIAGGAAGVVLAEGRVRVLPLTRPEQGTDEGVQQDDAAYDSVVELAEPHDHLTLLAAQAAAGDAPLEILLADATSPSGRAQRALLETLRPR